MKIIDVDVIVCSPGRNFVTIKVRTDEGIFGLGDATLNGRELAVAEYLRQYIIPCLIGKDPFDTEDIWQYLYRGVYWRKGPVNMTAIGAVDMALWDIKGKALGVPVYNLLGGRSRAYLDTYTHAQGTDLTSTLEEIGRLQDLGYSALRVQCGVPGLDKVYGVSSHDKYEPAREGERPVEEVWDSHKYIQFIPKLFEAVRLEFGIELRLLHDVHHRLTPNEAALVGKRLEHFDLFWLEDTTPAENQDALRLIRNSTSVPLAIGEIFNTVYDCQSLIINQLVDYIRMTIAHGGGITPMMKVASLASLYQIKMACHGPSDLSPINLAACIHFDTTINNFGIQEYMGYPAMISDVFQISHNITPGRIEPSDTPGLGVEVDLDAARKYPYKKSFLPVNRLVDRTLHNW